MIKNQQLPPHRRATWDALLAVDAVQLVFVDVGWTSGAVRRMVMRLEHAFALMQVRVSEWSLPPLGWRS